MKKPDYFTRFSRAVRWYLEAEEANDVIRDYRDIFRHVPGSMEEDPVQKARSLAVLGDYYRWLAVFSLFFISIVLAWYSVYQGDFREMLPFAVSSFLVGTAAGAAVFFTGCVLAGLIRWAI